jgi:hypothetical protein
MNRDLIIFKTLNSFHIVYAFSSFHIVVYPFSFFHIVYALSFLGCKLFKGYQNLVTTSPFFFLSFLPSPYLPYKDTFMDDYNGI